MEQNYTQALYYLESAAKVSANNPGYGEPETFIIYSHGYWDPSAVDMYELNGRLVWKRRGRKDVRWCVGL